MRERAADLLRCPMDGSRLELISWKETRRPLEPADRERASDLGVEPDTLERWIETGMLVNRSANIGYPIHRGVPRLLTFPTGVVDLFWSEHSRRISDELAVDRPRQSAPPGEEEILRTFSTEWGDYSWDEDRFWSMSQQAWLDALDLLMDIDESALPGRMALEVGIGIGGLADHLASDRSYEVFGIDLGHAVDGAVDAFGANPFLHVVQASAFALPFQSETFDLVCSLGVLHHTWSTHAAFQSVARVVRPNGQMFIWVYSPQEAASTAERRWLMRLEKAVRPVVSRLPTVPQTVVILPAIPVYIARQKARVRSGTNDYVTYGWQEALHAARDRLTPRFAHRHSEPEVIGWFEQAGFEDVAGNNSRPELAVLPPPLRLCTGVRGTRRPTLAPRRAPERTGSGPEIEDQHEPGQADEPERIEGEP